MKRTRVPLPCLALALLASLTLAGCPGKRPPLVATATPGAERSGGAGSTVPTQPLELGPDVQPVDRESLGEGALGADSLEGGPLADVHFDFDQAALTDKARADLERHALWLQNHREVKVTVEGHCDERGTVEYNLALGEQRARAAREYLVSLGVAPERLATVSYGKERPLDAGHDEPAWERNRRAHFVVSP